MNANLFIFIEYGLYKKSSKLKQKSFGLIYLSQNSLTKFRFSTVSSKPTFSCNEMSFCLLQNLIKIIPNKKKEDSIKINYQIDLCQGRTCKKQLKQLEWCRSQDPMIYHR